MADMWSLSGLPGRAGKYRPDFAPLGLDRQTTGHDFRCTVEAVVGGANSEQVAHAMGNTLSASNTLFATYVPVNVATLRDVMNARRVGRRKLRS
jgi:hypothetical protein